MYNFEPTICKYCKKTTSKQLAPCSKKSVADPDPFTCRLVCGSGSDHLYKLKVVKKNLKSEIKHLTMRLVFVLKNIVLKRDITFLFQWY